jgi:HTH-type transcriptional regulator / antitoxin HipB
MLSIKTPQDLGQALRIARKQLKMTQPQLALASGVGLRFIVELERGKATVRLESVMQVIEALGGQLILQGLPTPSLDANNAGLIND